MLNEMKRIVIIGATSSIAEHCARLWVEDSPVNMILVGRDMNKMEIIVADLQVRSPKSKISFIQADFITPIAIKDTVDKIVSVAPADIVLISHGALPDQTQCQNDLDACAAALTINGISPVLFAEAFAGHMQNNNLGTLAIIGSVAGERGRRSNYIYGSAKGLVARYVQGLQHRMVGTNVSVLLINPGPTATPMTANLKHQAGKLANVDEVAKEIVTGVKRKKLIIYAPKKWALIMMIVRHLPRAIFNRMSI
ncbi:Uncharacterized oxidoreductase SAV2478 [Yersinia frederiksenii]|uniref:SDR family NAD(P)-dependent oxidoreductase n=1 Tax=Yersinia frederiksenii TaxID=29484 RepID=UPI0005DD2FEE|nr:SDR family NAD(P)-dependent oxidoreductase [Yersinia frederiksenii]CFR02267.1 Uncharacterized oxidoreductase SAV2478 [Yersinia frederiksenii]